MPTKKVSWWQTQQIIISALGGLAVIFTFLVSNISADVRQTTRIERVEETMEELKDSDKEQEAQIEHTERQYDRLQQDVGYIKAGMTDVLTELKRKR